MLFFECSHVWFSTLQPGLSDDLNKGWKNYFDIGSLVGDILIFCSRYTTNDKVSHIRSEVVFVHGSHFGNLRSDGLLKKYVLDLITYTPSETTKASEGTHAMVWQYARAAHDHTCKRQLPLGCDEVSRLISVWE